MHSYADRHRHDYFFGRDYPDVKVLEGIYARLSEQPVAREDLERSVRLDADMFEKALNGEQLAAVMAPDGPILVLAAAGTGKPRTVGLTLF